MLDEGLAPEGGSKTRRLAEVIRRGILDGRWSDRLPTADRLAREYDVSLNTVRRAHDVLVAEGLVERRQGSGTYVTEHAVALRSRPRRIGVVLPSTTYYYPRVLHGIERAATERGATLQLACSHYDLAQEQRQVESLLREGVDGILLVATLLDNPDPAGYLRRLDELPVPVVLVERRLSEGQDDESEHVCTDHAAGAYAAVRHLHELGHERIGFVERQASPTSQYLEVGYRRGIERCGLPLVGEAWVGREGSDWTMRDAEGFLRSLRHARITATLCFGDREAILLQNAARAAGLRIPDDLAIVAYDDELAELADVPLSAVSPPKYEVGRTAVDVLFRRMSGGRDAPVQQVLLRPRLVVRDSCGAAGRDTGTPAELDAVDVVDGARP